MTVRFVPAALLLLLLAACSGVEEPITAPLPPRVSTPLDLARCDLSAVVDQMGRYQVHNAPFHNGYVLDHSAWTARAVANWFASGDAWVEGIPAELQPVTVLLAFLHDLGKAGDTGNHLQGRRGDYQVRICGRPPCEPSFLFNWKPDHAVWGFEYLTGERPFEWLVDASHGSCAGEPQSFRAHLECACPISSRELLVLSVGVGMHYAFGDYTRPDQRVTREGYLERLRELVDRAQTRVPYAVSADEVATLVQLFSVVGAADVLGAHPVELGELPAGQREFLGQMTPRARFAAVPESEEPYRKYAVAESRSMMRELMRWVAENWAAEPTSTGYSPEREGRSRSRG